MPLIHWETEKCSKNWHSLLITLAILTLKLELRFSHDFLCGSHAPPQAHLSKSNGTGEGSLQRSSHGDGEVAGSPVRDYAERAVEVEQQFSHYFYPQLLIIAALFL